MLGAILVKVAFVSCLVAVVCYFRSHFTGSARLLKLGRRAYYLTILSVLGVAGTLLYLILTHQFQYTYVWSESSRSLPLPLLISTFYAGQEGSFTLWTLFTSIIAIVLIRHSSRKGYEAAVMGVFGMIQLALLTMLILKNPFLRIWESWPGQVAEGYVPPDGRGLNPLLQNYWMVIHPQVLFSGFSSMAVPYAYAVAALLKRDYNNWFRAATPWLVFAALILGTGIMMGGFWAYETLGWGGYWGWDPVENSSLVPWLFAVATIHTILAQRKNGRFVRTNFALAIMTFLMVLYSTFLTRSGVLGDTSVHSFVDPGMWVYWALIAIIVLFAGLAIGLFVKRWKEMPRPQTDHDLLSREFALILGSMVLVAAAIFIILGTSRPLISDLLEGKKSAQDISYYAYIAFPAGIAIGLLSGIGQLLWWTRSDRGALLRSLRIPVGLAALVVGGLALAGVLDPVVLVLLYFASFALFANIAVGARIMKGNPKYAGGSIAHVGLALLFFGFVASTVYQSKETVSLPQGTPVPVLGYNLTYRGYGPIDRERYAFHVNVEKDGRSRSVAPIMYYSSYNEGLMRNPDILNLFTHDLYVAPLSLDQKDDRGTALENATFRRGESKKIADLEVRFIDFDFPAGQQEAMMEGKEVHIGATFEVKQYGKEAVTITPFKIINRGQTSDQPATVGKEYEFAISTLRPNTDNPDSSTVEISVTKLNPQAASAQPQQDTLIAEVTVKPFINLVWTGIIVLLVGLIVTIVRRSQEAAIRRSRITVPPQKEKVAVEA